MENHLDLRPTHHIPDKKFGLLRRFLRSLKRPVPLLTVLGTVFLAVSLTAWTIIESREANYEILLPEPPSGFSPLNLGSWPALENAEFFKRVKEQFIAQGASFIESDLSAMTIRVYQDGELKREVPIISKGREGSWWETPAGLYKIQSKEANHFSSFGQVYMPWSMAFQGNFFIHGWPYYPNGQPVAEGYSGGCIRLSDEDAKQIYDLAEPGMPVLVFEQDFKNDGFEYELLGSRLTAQNYLSADLGNNFVFAEKGSREVTPIASLTKLMTALIATEYINVEREVTITSDMLVSTSRPRLWAGQRVSVLHLLYPLLTESSNEAGVAIARILGTERFVSLMNEKAQAIGMSDTHFADATGASPENTSTAQDLFQLAKYLYNNRSFVLAISKGDVGKSAYDPPRWADLQNFNVFAGDADFVGGKVGMTEAAGETILSIFKTGSGENKRPVVVIALGSEDRASDAAALINHIRTSY